MFMVESNTRNRIKIWPGVICFTGTDGTGKTTQADLLLDEAKATNKRVVYRWFHYARLFSLPLLVYARLCKYSRYEEVDEQKFGWWEFEASWILCNILPWLMLIDAFCFSIIRIYLPLLRGYSIIADRYIWDIMVDIMQGTSRNDLHLETVGKLFLKLAPRNTAVFLLDADVDSLPERRNDIKNDKRLQNRVLCYRKLANDTGIPIINAGNTIDTIHDEIITILNRRRNTL